MKRLMAVVSVTLLLLGALALAGCGEQETQSPSSGTSASGPPPGDADVGTRGAGGPEGVVEAYLEALIQDDVEEAKSYWDPNSLESFAVSTNDLTKIQMITGPAGREDQVTAIVYYTECESGEESAGTILFTLEESGGQWSIVSAEPDYE